MGKKYYEASGHFWRRRYGQPFCRPAGKSSQVVIIDEWPEAIAAIREHGIRIEDSDSADRVPIEAYLPGEPVEPADLAIVLVKAWQTGKVAIYLNSCLRPDGLAVTLQNGLGNLEILGSRAFPGATAMGATLLGPGHVRTGGEGLTQMVAPDWAVDLFRASGLSARRCEENEAESLLWGKLCVSCGINGLTALLRISNGELLERPDASELMVRAAEECAAVAHARGIKLPFSNPADHVRECRRYGPPPISPRCCRIFCGERRQSATPSMALLRGKPCELGVPAPVNSILWQLVLAASHQTGTRNADS